MAKTKPTDPPRRIVLTGATRGCGRVLVERFIESGHTVVGCGRSASHVTELRKQFGSPHRFDAVDVSDDRQVAAWARSVMEAGLVPDLLLNNAAVMNEPAAPPSRIAWISPPSLTPPARSSNSRKVVPKGVS